MSLQARILYDFEGDIENGELVIEEGKIITVLSQDIGDGWWEGQLENGEVGLFPESYVEIIEQGAETAAFNGYQDGIRNGAMDEDQFQQRGRYRQDSFDQQANKWEDEEEDWETQQRQGGYNDFGGDETGGYRDDTHSPGDRSNSQLARAGTVRKNINRYYSPHFKEKSHYTQRCPHFRGLEVPAPLMPSLIDTETSSALKKVVQESGFGKEQFNRVQKIILRTLE